MRRTTLLSAALLILPLGLSAQAHPLVGEWKLDMVVGGRTENGTHTPIKGTGTLTVTAAGDSLVAALATDPVEDRPARPPIRMATLNKAGDLVFVARGTATLNMNGAAREATSVSTYTFKVNGNTLEGTVERRLEGVDDIPLSPQPPQPVTGTRKTS